MFETFLRGEGHRRLAEIGAADILIGIPTFRNSRTISTVGRAAAEGLVRYFPQLRGAIAIVDGGSSDDTVAAASSFDVPPGVRRVVTSYQGLGGKGSAVRAIFEMTRMLHSQICVVLEADLRSITPDWVQRLIRPILSKEYSLALPWYYRPLPEGAVTDMLAYPLTRMLYGTDIRQPMGGEFALSAELAGRFSGKDVWETDVARHGIDIWLTTVAVNEGARLCQVRLGTKIDDSREMLLSFDPTFVQSVGTLFRMMDIYRRRWPPNKPVSFAPFHGDNPRQDASRHLPCLTAESLADAFTSGARRHARIWRSAISPQNRAAVKQLAERPDGGFHFPADLWARIVFDFAVVYNRGEGDPDKIVGALLPLYYARTATVMKETGLIKESVERAVIAQAETFVQEKPYLLRRWNSYVPWEWEGVR